jgi:hypothetical protein
MLFQGRPEASVWLPATVNLRSHNLVIKDSQNDKDVADFIGRGKSLF